MFYFITNICFAPLRETIQAGRVKLFAEAVELFTQAAIQLVFFRKTASSDGTKKMKVGGR
jgi:hypothetical protein